jgi:hypothetical protein
LPLEAAASAEAPKPPPPSQARNAPPPLPADSAPSAEMPPPSSKTVKAAIRAGDGGAGADIWYGLRVAVEPSPRDPNMLIVRRLDARQPAPAGTREALIVVLDSGADLFGTAPAVVHANKRD